MVLGLHLGIRGKIHNFYEYKIRNPYLANRQHILAKRLKNKETINVLFVLTSLGAWKTERLYKAMLEHPRFNPKLLLTIAGDENSVDALKKYMESKEYNYSVALNNCSIKDFFSPDIIFYQKPYEFDLKFEKLRYYHYPDCLFCYVPYGMHSALEIDVVNVPLLNIAWQVYYESEIVKNQLGPMLDNKGRNIVVTGLPFNDSFISYNDEPHINPWKPQNCKKKKIIYAPHHTINHSTEWLPYSTFLQYYDFMLKMAEKYYDKVQFAFKPHPSLKVKLYNFWGKKKTDEYYQKWNDLTNGQLELGNYVELFMTSDAMIHDCSSFQEEYMFTHNPVLFLTNNEENQRKGLTEQALKAYDLQYKGHNEKEIEEFIQNVIAGVDPWKKDRDEFFNNYLLPPNGKTATENIVDSIIGNL